MKQNYTKIVFVIDRSGSMERIKNDMNGGFKTFIDAQKSANLGKCDVSVYQFDHELEPVFEHKNIMDSPSYALVPRGGTALYDAVGKTILKVGAQLGAMDENERPDRVMMVITTDGEENSSVEFNVKKIKEMVTHQTDVYHWQFTYLGSNQDAWEVGKTLGVASASTLTYANNARGVNSSWTSLSEATKGYRSTEVVYTGSFAYTNSDLEEQSEALKEPQK
jgi:uncharacterized protein YegL